MWIVLLNCCTSQEESDRLAGLAEAVGGWQVSDTGFPSPLTPDTHREILGELPRPGGTAPPPALSVDWLIDRFRHK